MLRGNKSEFGYGYNASNNDYNYAHLSSLVPANNVVIDPTFNSTKGKSNLPELSKTNNMISYRDDLSNPNPYEKKQQPTNDQKSNYEEAKPEEN